MTEAYWSTDKTIRDFKLENQLLKALQDTGVRRRSFGEINPKHLPTPKVNFGGISTEEMFVLMVLGFQRVRTLEQRSDAEKEQAKSLRMADEIVDTLPRNDSAVEFINKAMILIQDQNPPLGEYLVDAMQAAHKRGTLRQQRREKLFKSWYAKQKHTGRS